MTVQSQVSAFIPSDYDIFAGLDVDKGSIAMTFSNHKALLKSLRLPYSSEQLLNYVRKHFPEQRVVFVYEAGPTGFGLHDDLVANNHPCLVVAPSMVPTAPGQRVKTNRLDSKKLSIGLRGGELRSIHVPSRSYRELRHLVQLRDTHSRQLTATKCRIKALLLYEGIPFPPAPGGQWSARIVAELRALPCTEEVRFKLDHLIGTLYFHFNSAAVVQKRIRRFCQNDPELRQSISLLTSLPGIGWIVAAHSVARLGDWREIKNVRQIAGFLGLVSSEHSTGEKENRGPITRSGDSHLRNKLIQKRLGGHPQRSGTARFLPPYLRAPFQESSGAQSHCGGSPKVDDAHVCRLETTTAVCVAAGQFISSFDRRGDRWPQGTPRRQTERAAVTG